MPYRFIDEKNTMVITTRKIINREKPILLVSHDEDDGMWEFLDGSEVEEEDALVVALYEIVELDDSVNNIADLPVGWVAYRNTVNDEWDKYSNIS